MNNNQRSSFSSRSRARAQGAYTPYTTQYPGAYSAPWDQLPSLPDAQLEAPPSPMLQNGWQNPLLVMPETPAAQENLGLSYDQESNVVTDWMLHPEYVDTEGTVQYDANEDDIFAHLPPSHTLSDAPDWNYDNLYPFLREQDILPPQTPADALSSPAQLPPSVEISGPDMRHEIELPSSMQSNNASISGNAPELKTPAIGTIPLPTEAPPAFTTEQHLPVPSPHFISSPAHNSSDMFSSPTAPQASASSFGTSMNEGHSAHHRSLATNDKSIQRFSPPAAPAPLIPSPTYGPSVLPETLPQSLPKRSPRRGESSGAGPSRTTREPRENAPRKSGVRPPKFRTEEEWDAVHRYPNGELKPATEVGGGKWKCVCSERPVTLRTIRERHQKFERRICAEKGCGKDLGRPDALVRHRCTEHKMHVDCATNDGKGGCERKLGGRRGSERGESRGH